MTNQKGFTAIEVIIVLAVSSILMMGLFNLFEWHQKVFVMEEATVRTSVDVRMAMLSMSKYIAQSTNIVATRTVDGTVYSSSGTTLVLEVPSINSSDNVIAVTYDYVVFNLDAGSLYQIIETGTGSTRKGGTKKIAENIHTFALTYNNGTPSAASIIDINIQARVVTRNGNVSTGVADSIFLRNK